MDYEENLCVVCACDMGPDNPRQLCGKTHCHNQSEFFELLSSKLNVDSKPGWINYLGSEIETGDKSTKHLLKRLIFNLNKYWENLKDIPIDSLVSMTDTEMTSLVRIRQSKPLPIITPTNISLEAIHESPSDWYRK